MGRIFARRFSSLNDLIIVVFYQFFLETMFAEWNLGGARLAYGILHDSSEQDTAGSNNLEWLRIVHANSEQHKGI